MHSTPRRRAASLVRKKNLYQLPPSWRIRKIGQHWCVMRLAPIRHTIYFPVVKVSSFDDAILWLCQRYGKKSNSPKVVVIEEGTDNY